MYESNDPPKYGFMDYLLSDKQSDDVTKQIIHIWAIHILGDGLTHTLLLECPTELIN